LPKAREAWRVRAWLDRCYAAVSAAIKSMERKLADDKELRGRLDAAEKALQF